MLHLLNFKPSYLNANAYIQTHNKMIPYLVMEASLSMDVINHIPKHFLFTLATSFKAETAIFPLNFFQLTNGLDF